MGDRWRRAEPTTDWMIQDVAQRCRDVLALLDQQDASPAQLGNAAVLLRGAADDLVSLVELVEGGDTVDFEVSPQAFGLSFGMDQPAPDGSPEG